MTINPELMNAILSMDSYDQGYDNGITFSNRNGNSIGNFTRGNDSSILDSATTIDVAKAAGFYAVSYSWSGQTIVAYRGTVNSSLCAAAAGRFATGIPACACR